MAVEEQGVEPTVPGGAVDHRHQIGVETVDRPGRRPARAGPRPSDRYRAMQIHELGARRTWARQLHLKTKYEQRGGQLSFAARSGRGQVLDRRSTWSGDLLARLRAPQWPGSGDLNLNADLELQGFPSGPVPQLSGVAEARVPGLRGSLRAAEGARRRSISSGGTAPGRAARRWATEPF